MSVLRDVVGLLVLSLFWGCSASRDVVLGDLPFPDVDIGEEGSAPDGSPDPDSGSLTDATSTDALGDSSKPCPSGEAVPAPVRAFLADAIGFGRSATGGLNGCIYHVKTLDDAGPGSLRDGAERAEPLWIVFDVSGDIVLTSPIAMGSNKTLDGRGADIIVRNFGLNLVGTAVSNVVIEHLTFVGNLQGSDNDAIKITEGAHTVWIDHCSLSNFKDGLIDITHAATDITVSWSVFSMHEYVMLIGRSPDDVDDVNIRVTVHHNWWNQTGSYAPRLRFGKAHVLNNLIDRWRTAASACTMGGEIYSEGNIFNALNDKTALATMAGSDTLRGKAKSIGDALQNSAVVLPWDEDLVFQPLTFYPYTAAVANATLQSAIMVGAGVH